MNFLFGGTALSDQTSCRFALALVAKTLAVLLRLDKYFQLRLYIKHQIIVFDDYVTNQI